MAVKPPYSYFICRQLTEPQPQLPRTPRKCHLSRSEAHLHLIRRFAGTTFEQKVDDFCMSLYRCVRLHCGKKVSEAIALVVIQCWVASCLSEAPITTFDSPVLSFCSDVAVDSTSSSQDSFRTLSSTEDSFVSEDIGLDVLSAANLLGWAPSDDDI